MPVAFPSEDEVILQPPDQEEAAVLARGVIGAVTPATGLSPLQRVLLQSVFRSMTGFSIDASSVDPLGPDAFAAALRRRNLEFRTRITQVMLLGELVLDPVPEDVADRVLCYSAALGVDDAMIFATRGHTEGSLGLALVDFERNGYTSHWAPERSAAVHTRVSLAEAWEPDCDDPELAARWAALENYPPGSLGRRVFEFYRARGFSFPGLPGSAPPHLAQHDWVHVLADYGTTVESELEVFGLIGRAIPDPRGFSLLAMVVGLFETGQVQRDGGIFEASPGHLSEEGMAERLADAMYRGAKCGRDLMGIDYFEYAGMAVEAVREELGIVPKSEGAILAGSVGPWQPGGISPFQVRAGTAAADHEGRPYVSYGAEPPA